MNEICISVPCLLLQQEGKHRGTSVGKWMGGFLPVGLMLGHQVTAFLPVDHVLSHVQRVSSKGPLHTCPISLSPSSVLHAGLGAAAVTLTLESTVLRA